MVLPYDMSAEITRQQSWWDLKNASISLKLPRSVNTA
jgi:hypothetical protein